jgi:circadian clock protein KaiC
VSGTAGTGKSSLGAWFAAAACRRGERCLIFAFEESAPQIVRNMRSVGNDLQPWLDQGLLRIQSARSTTFGLEMHLVQMLAIIKEFRPTVAVIDPVSNFIAAGMPADVKAMLARVIDAVKSEGITCLFTSLTFGHLDLEGTETNISSLMDTWIMLKAEERDGERIRLLTVLKSRGMAHSNQVREFILSRRGMQLPSVHREGDGAVAGSARISTQAAQRPTQSLAVTPRSA